MEQGPITFAQLSTDAEFEKKGITERAIGMTAR
jgi:hypothetical protein